jgi:hypothetical protein
MPAHSVTSKLSILKDAGSRSGVRFGPEVMFGLSKKWMLHFGSSFSNLYQANTSWESLYFYSKFRFLSIDDVRKHFRMAAFALATYSRNRYRYEEVAIQGERSGVQLGFIATQLINKFAISGSVSNVQAFDPSRTDKIYYTPERNYQAVDYSVSAGLLLLPKEYKGYNQLNINLYTELLGQKTFENGLYYLDLAPAVQFIFNSNSKLNLGYRFELKGNEQRSMYRGFLLSFEHTFFNTLK